MYSLTLTIIIINYRHLCRTLIHSILVNTATVRVLDRWLSRNTLEIKHRWSVVVDVIVFDVLLSDGIDRISAHRLYPIDSINVTLQRIYEHFDTFAVHIDDRLIDNVTIDYLFKSNCPNVPYNRQQWLIWSPVGNHDKTHTYPYL
jgi:hypothetical protein